MADAPFITGNDLTAQKGDAALGLGNGVSYQFNPENQNPLGQINSTLDRLQQQDYANSVMKYHQSIKDRDSLLDRLVYTGGSLANTKDANGKDISLSFLPEDQKVLTEKADTIRRGMGKNWSKSMTDPEVQKQMDDYKRLVQHASARAYALTDDQLKLSKENDPMERQRIQDNINNEVVNKKLTDFHRPEPHLPKLSFNIENIIPSKDLKDKNAMADFQVSAGTDPSGNIVYTTKTGLKDDIYDIRNRVMRDSNLWGEAQNMVSSWLQSEGKDVNAIAAMNKNIDEINKQRGYVDANGNPISPHYTPHAADVIQGPNGPQIKYNENPINIAYAIVGEKYGNLQSENEIKKSAIEVANTKSEIQKRKDETDIAYQRLKQDKDKAQKEYEVALSKGNKEDAKEAAIERDGINANMVVHRAFTRYRKDGKPLPAADVATIETEITNQGLDPAKFKVVAIPQNDPDVKNILSEPGTDLFAKTNGTLKAPVKAYALISKDGKIKDDMVLAAFRDGGSNKNPVFTYRIMTTNSAVENFPISKKRGGKPTDKDVAISERASDIYADAEKGAKIWGIEQEPAQQPKAKAAAKATAAPDGIPPAVAKIGTPTSKSTLNGKTYYKVAGQWVDDTGAPYKKS